MGKRKEEKKAPQKAGAPAYMATYGDMMTLLMCFFVLLFSMAEVDAEKFSAVMSSFTGSTSVLDGGEMVINSGGMLSSQGVGDNKEEFISQAELAELADIEAEQALQDIQEYIDNHNIQEEVAVDRDGTEITITFDAVLLFDSGKSVIKKQGIPVLETLGPKLEEYLEQGYRMRMEGHTDNVPIQTVQFPSNWELSASRAIAVAKFYINELGFDSKVISAEGFGEQVPIADNSTPEGRSQNRRVEIKLSKDISK